jgi:hypothetical protein
MAIYRRASRRPLAIAAIIAATAGLAIGFALGRSTAPDLASQVHAARAEVSPIVTALEVVRDEYPKLLAASAGSDPGGAEAALVRATTALASRAVVLRTLEPVATAALEAAMARLSQLIAERAPESQVRAALDEAQAAAARLAGAPAPSSSVRHGIATAA